MHEYIINTMRFALLLALASFGAVWTHINSASCPTSCWCRIDVSKLQVSCQSRHVDREQLSKQLESFLSSKNMTIYRQLTKISITYTPLTHVPRSFICRLTTLTRLDLWHNRLTQLPDNCLTNLTALTSLSASRNNTHLPDWLFDGLHKLQTLSLYGNRISSVGPRSFVGLVRLERLYLKYNRISKLQDGVFDGLPELEILDLSGNRMSSVGIRAFSGLTKLVRLNLRYNHITDLKTGLFGGLGKLETLNLYRNRISSMAPHVFDGLSKLKILDLSKNNLSSVGLRAFWRIYNLKTLDLSYNHITELQDSRFSGLHSLRTLDLRFNYISSIGLRAFQGLDQLESLNLSNNYITGLEAGFLDELYKLETLNLSYNHITKIQVGLFDGLHKLKTLDLHKNRISSVGLGAFDGLTELNKLSLSNNYIRVLNDGHFVGLPKLNKLYISDNRISSIGLQAFDGMRNLKRLDLSNNKLTEMQLNGLFGGLEKLETLVLSRNHIKKLQDGLFDGLQKLEAIYLWRNFISSIGPRVFGGSATLNSLRYVDLASNKLQTLESWPLYTSMNHTVTINLKYNNISDASTNVREWEKNCSTRTVHFSLLLDGNPIRHVSDLLSGWNMSSLTTRCFASKKYRFPPTIDCVYLDCGCANFIIFRLRLPLRTGILNGVMSNRSLTQRQDDAVPLDQFVCELTERCPSGCRCVHRPANATLHIDCSNTNLTVLPLELPELHKSYTKYKLDFSNNPLRRLEHRDYFVNTSILDVSNSGIQRVESDDVWKDILKIPQLNLYRNKLASLPQSVISLNVTTVSLNIANNTWDCSCDNKWMSGWLNSISNRLTQNVRCYRPPRLSGKNIIETSEEEFCVDPVVEAAAEAATEVSRRIWIPVTSTSSVAGVVVVLLSAIFYRLRVKLYTRWKFRPFDRDECPGEDMDYDVFLCCSSLDDEPVGSRILDSVEANGYRVCYHERDFMPGLLITDSVAASVTRSKRTVCLLTDNFIQRSANVWYYCFYHSVPVPIICVFSAS